MAGSATTASTITLVTRKPREEDIAGVPWQPEIEVGPQELFRDEFGNIFDVTVRGRRHPLHIYFRAFDVGRMVGDAIGTICNLRERKGFVEGIDFVVMAMDSSCSTVELYFTYRGLLKQLIKYHMLMVTPMFT